MSSPKPGTPAGTITSLHRYPVKGMSGEALAEIQIGFHGPRGDRGYAWLRLNDTSGLPFLSPRRCPQLLTYTARTEGQQIIVTTPSGHDYDLRDPQLKYEIENLADEPLHLIQLWSHATDAMDTSLITTNTIASAEQLTGCELEPDRFRANIVLDTPDDTRPYPEDRWACCRVG